MEVNTNTRHYLYKILLRTRKVNKKSITTSNFY